MIELDYCDKKNKGIIKGSSLTEIREYFSEKNEAAKFLRHRYKFLPQRKYAITPTGRYNPGLTIEICKFIENSLPNEKVLVTKKLFDIITPGTLWEKNIKDDYKQIVKLNYELYDYQKEVVSKCLGYGRGTVVLATAGGKTLITSALINNIKNIIFNKHKFKCIFIVPSLSLVDQTVDKFKEYGVNFTFSKWTGNNALNTNTDVIVCNLGILQSKNTDLSFLKNIDLLVVDEVHMLRHGNIFNKIVDSIDTPYKFGFTGTLPESNIDRWNIIGKIGPIIYEKRSYELRKDKKVSNAQISILELNYRSHPIQAYNIKDKYRAELEFIIDSPFRNRVINKVTTNANNNILILVDFIRHGEKLFNILTTNNPREKEIYFIQGSVDTEIRERIRKTMEYKNNVVCIAISKIFSTGIDIKNLHYIIFSGGGKAKIKILQSIGRGLRLHENKKILQIVDICDHLYYGLEHSKKRIKFYEQEKIPYQKTTLTE